MSTARRRLLYAQLIQEEVQPKLVYEIEAVYLSWNAYQIRVAQGEIDTPLQQNIHNEVPVSLREAEEICLELGRLKQAEGYKGSLSVLYPIDHDAILAYSQDDRQAIINELKTRPFSQFVEELTRINFDPREHLLGLDLSHIDFSNADLCFCNLSQTNLSGANLTQANLQGIYLEGSSIDQTTRLDSKWQIMWTLVNQGHNDLDLRGVNLSGIEVSWMDEDAVIDLSGADLERAIFKQMDLGKFIFTGANLKNADLSGAEEATMFDHSNLENANLSDMCAYEPTFNHAICIKANFSGFGFGGEFVGFYNANCEGANFQDARLTLSGIDGANFSHANFTNVQKLHDFLFRVDGEPLSKGVNFQGANFSRVNLSRFSFNEAFHDYTVNFQEVQFNQAILTGTHLSGFDLRGASFYEANLEGANLAGCNLESADLTRANLKSTNLKEVDLSQIYSLEGIEINAETQVDPEWQELLESSSQDLANS
ncbi:MAG: pentapeptide repeat-containing protein [Leptolyngbyaceae cyanobacterium]